MGKSSQNERLKIFKLFSEGYSRKEIANQLGFSKPTVSRWINRVLTTENLADLPRSGRPKCMNIEEEDRLVNYFHDNPFNTMKDCI
jgi:transposase